jgi:hypothetical protein
MFAQPAQWYRLSIAGTSRKQIFQKSGPSGFNRGPCRTGNIGSMEFTPAGYGLFRYSADTPSAVGRPIEGSFMGHTNQIRRKTHAA